MYVCVRSSLVFLRSFVIYSIDYKYCEVLCVINKYLTILEILRVNQFHSILDFVINLQRVYNAAATLIFGGRKFCRVKPLICDKLCWLEVSQRFIFKLGLLPYKAVHIIALRYLGNLCHTHPSITSRRSPSFWRRTAGRSARRNRRFCNRGFSVAGQLALNSFRPTIHQVDGLLAFTRFLNENILTCLIKVILFVFHNIAYFFR